MILRPFLAIALTLAVVGCGGHRSAGLHDAPQAMNSETVLTPKGGTPIKDSAEIARRTQAAGILLRHWDQRLPAELKGKDYAAEDKERILGLYREDITKLKSERGYVAEDVIALRPENKQLDEIMKKFNRCHTHSDDEVRAILDGHGVFTIFPATGDSFDLRVGAGDVLIIPAGTRHLFNLAEDRSISAIRIYKDKAGWAAVYCDDVKDAAVHP